MRDQSGARAAELEGEEVGTKWRRRALQFRYLTVSPSLFVAKDQARSVIESIGVKIIVYSQTNSLVGVVKKKKMEKIDRFPCITVAVYFSYFLGVSLGRESLANHDHIPKKA